jgi:hypothetical protein
MREEVGRASREPVGGYCASPLAAFPDVFDVPNDKPIKRPTLLFEDDERSVKVQNCVSRYQSEDGADAEHIKKEESRRKYKPPQDPPIVRGIRRLRFGETGFSSFLAHLGRETASVMPAKEFCR